MADFNLGKRFFAKKIPKTFLAENIASPDTFRAANAITFASREIVPRRAQPGGTRLNEPLLICIANQLARCGRQLAAVANHGPRFVYAVIKSARLVPR